MSAADDIREAFQGRRGKILIVGGAIAIVGYVAYTRWNGTPEEVIDPTEQTPVESDATRVPQSQPPVGNDTQTGTVNTRPQTNPDWISQGVDVLRGRAVPADAAFTALSKALEGSQVTSQESAWVSQVIAVLGSPPEGMPPLNSAPPTQPGGGGKAPAAPGGLRVSALSPTAATISWSPVPTAEGYTVKFSGRIITVKPPSGPNARFTNLKKGGGYAATVQAYNRYGTGPASTIKWTTPKK